MKTIEVGAINDGTNIVIAADAAKSLWILGYHLNHAAGAPAVVTLETTDGANLAVFTMDVNATISYAGSPNAPAFVFPHGLGFQIVCAAGSDVRGHLTYMER